MSIEAKHEGLESSFIAIKNANCDEQLFTDDYPSRLVSWNYTPATHPQVTTELTGDTWFGFVMRSTRVLQNPITGNQQIWLPDYSYFAFRGPIKLIGGSGFAVQRVGHTALDMLGGPLEREGRLSYIDGCSDSLLVSPVKLGDPCFNLLHFPPGITQTMHTHPSNRIGMVVGGVGRCITPFGQIPLNPGMRFIIPKDGKHCFYTDSLHMDVVAFHPDSDVGPTDEKHPMLTRTMVDGVSAAEIPEIQTRNIVRRAVATSYSDGGKNI